MKKASTGGGEASSDGGKSCNRLRDSCNGSYEKLQPRNGELTMESGGAQGDATRDGGERRWQAVHRSSTMEHRWQEFHPVGGEVATDRRRDFCNRGSSASTIAGDDARACRRERRRSNERRQSGELRRSAFSFSSYVRSRDMGKRSARNKLCLI